ncbi:MAG: presenilin family intramembrane aspartyl protease [Candidatus Bathyarchaeia archaeon]
MAKAVSQIVYLVPVVASLLFGLACAYLLLSQPVSSVPVTPFQEGTTSATLGNAIYFVVLVATGAFVLYILLKWKNRKLITFLTAFALTAASILLSLFYFSAVLVFMPNSEMLLICLTVVVTIVVDVSIFVLDGGIRNGVVICLGGALGVFFGFSIPFLSAVLILCFLAVYDVFAVYKGPVGKIAHVGLDQLKGLSFSFKDVQMGLGDLVFYSMLSSSMLFNFGWISYSTSLVGILTGSLLTFVMLERKGIFPGLPLPVFLGLAGGFLVTIV